MWLFWLFPWILFHFADSADQTPVAYRRHITVSFRFLIALGDKVLELLFSKRYHNDHFYTCAICDSIVSQRIAYTNLCIRVSLKHINDVVERREPHRTWTPKAFRSEFLDRKTLVNHVWIVYVFSGLQRFYFFENESFCHCFKQEIICRKTPMLYLQRLVCYVQSKIKTASPYQTGIV